ncbi:hypothetical protein EV641_10618 [Rhodococcus sp. SMB37]|uniref:hypothetical protein n=1 Tax=Rhodococcus sp. SMB37 TaxID=2512213 RepID=UPI0010D39825|nr:hypothetical protein [Rhodococcus sp. SMB37]TCN53374.1 hypothetical protein EV641_10618 [Rhodococcus sp. SMB37]
MPSPYAVPTGYRSARPAQPSRSTRWLDILVLWHAIMAIPNEHDTAGWAFAL